MHYRIREQLKVSVDAGEPWDGNQDLGLTSASQLIHQVKRLTLVNLQPSHLNNGCIGLNYFLNKVPAVGVTVHLQNSSVRYTCRVHHPIASSSEQGSPEITEHFHSNPISSILF